MEASLHFYRDILGYDVLDRGRLGHGLPTMPGVGSQGRGFALLRHNEKIVGERGVIRLLDAPRGALANRPRPASRIVDPGWATIEGHPHDWQLAYHTMVKEGIRTLSGPLYYWGIGQQEPPKQYSITFSAFGPAGEQMFISSHPSVEPNYAGLFGPLFRHTLMCLDRWPVLDFYEAAFGLKSNTDRYVGEETLNYRAVNLMDGAPPGTYKRTLGYSSLPNEIWEFRQWDPALSPVWPTDLDRTGLAMITILVDSLGVALARCRAAGIAILGQGALPAPGVAVQDGFYIRGAVGELIEVVGRG
jgi:catechol 2,3-dioxygenase-like lactoylglutathione lyase family enzyme